MLKTFPSGANQLRALLTPEPAPGKAILDDTSDTDSGTGAADFVDSSLRLSAATAVQSWAETPADDLAEGETSADRLLMLVVGIVDADKDGEISDDEQEVANAVLEFAWEYLSIKGVSDEDCSALLNDWDPVAADRVKDLVAASLPAGEDDLTADLDSFAFDSDSDQAIFDSTGARILDAVYRKKVVVRGGKKMRVMKRVSGHVRLSAKQKIAVRKMQRRSHSAGAMIRRMKSLRVRKSAGL